MSDPVARREISELTRAYREHYAAAYSYLAAARAANPAAQGALHSADDMDSARRRARSAAERELPAHGGDGGSRAERFLRAITCGGELLCSDTLTALCPRVYVLDASLGLAGVFLTELAAMPRGAAMATSSAPTPSTRGGRTPLLLPSRGAAYVAGGSGEELPFKPSRRLHLDSARLRSLTREERRSLESDRRAAASLRHCAVDALSSASGCTTSWRPSTAPM